MFEQAENFYRQAHGLLLQAPPDYKGAVPLLRQAAQAGHAEAAFQLSACFMNGTGVPQNIAEGIAYLKQAADAGHGYARYNLLRLQEEQGVDISGLIADYAELAEQGMAEAQLRLMRAYNEAGRADDAVVWAEQAAVQNHPQALYFLARHYQYAAEPDLRRAHEFYHRAAEQGLVAAHWQLGLQYKLGQGVEQDLPRAAVHLEIAARDGIAAAQTALAEILLPSDAAGALKWFQTAARQGSNDACAALAEIYLSGRFVQRNPETARQYAQSAGKHHPEALRLLGDIHRYGLGVAADAAKALAYYRRAADLGSMAAHQKLLSDSALNDVENYRQTKEAALQRQKAETLYRQAFAAHHGIRRSQNYAEALPLYHEAARLGHGRAQTNLGMMYYGGLGVETDFSQAAKWFERAAEQNDGMAQYNLACLYFHGMGVPQSAAKACGWLQRAIDGGHDPHGELAALLAQWRQDETFAKPQI